MKMSVSSSSSENNQEDPHWRGSPMSEIYRGWSEWELNHLPPVSPSDNHKVLYHCPLRSNDMPRPIRGSLKWDANHVRLPCSTESLYPITKSDGTVIVESRWELIRKALSKPINNSRELEAAILSYNSKYEKIWKFHALHLLFEDELTEDESKLFFVNILPKMTKLALKLPELIQASIPLLRQGQNRSISLSQQQISCLLANAFFCTFPRRNTLKKRSEYSSFPDINFNRLYQSSGQQVIEKIKCICNYFRRVCNTTPTGVMTFTRRSISESQLPNWSESNVPLGITPLHVSSAGTIEDQGKGLLQVDFANKFLGGGVLGGGCVQEEIRFVICPELIISKLFTEALKPCEALVIVGCEQFNQYKGYASSFTWDGNFEDLTPSDCSRRRQCSIVAIDALFFKQSAHQYREELMLRELNKAYVGFYHPLDTPAPGVASGNWGCGAFGGEATLKALIQLMACTATRRPLVYYTFGNKELRDAIHDIHTFFIENNVTIKRLWHYLKEFRAHKLLPTDLYGFICQIHRDHKTRKDTGMNSEQSPPNNCSPSKKPLQNTMTNTITKDVSKKEVQTPSPKQTSGNKSTDPSTNLDKSPDLFSPYKSPISKKQDTSINKTPKSVAENRVEQQNAVENECENVQSTSKSAEINENSKELRQKSLLEMLDWSYYKGSPNKRKRDTS